MKEATMRERDYPSNVTNAEWKILEPLIPPTKEGGRPQTTKRREIVEEAWISIAMIHPHVEAVRLIKGLPVVNTLHAEAF